MLRKGTNKIIFQKKKLSWHLLLILGLVGVGQYPSFLRALGISEQTNMVVFAMTVVGPSTILLRPPEAAVCPGKIELCTSYLLFQSHYTLPPIIVVAEPLYTFSWTIFDSKSCRLRTKNIFWSPADGSQWQIPNPKRAFNLLQGVNQGHWLPLLANRRSLP